MLKGIGLKGIRKKIWTCIFCFSLVIPTVNATTGNIFYVTADAHLGLANKDCSSSSEICTSYEPKILNQTVLTNLINTTKVKSNTNNYMLIVGDLTQNSSESQVNNYLKTIGSSNNKKIFSSLGNHDIRQRLGTSTVQEQEETYISHRNYFIKSFGSIDKSWDVGTNSDKVKLIRIGTNYKTPPVTPWDVHAFGYGYLSSSTKKFLEKELSSAYQNNQIAIVMTHWPISETICYSNSGYRLASDLEKVDTSINKIINKYPNAIIISGHTHKRYSYCGKDWYYIGNETNSSLNTSHSIYLHAGSGIKGTYNNDGEPITDFLKLKIIDNKSVEFAQQYFNNNDKSITKGLAKNWSWYKVSYNCNGGTTPPKDTYRYQKAAVNTCTRTGYSFVGWNTKKNGTGTKYNAKAIVDNGAADSTLYAEWKINTYTLKYDSNGGIDCNPKTIKKEYNSVWGTLCTPTRKGYIFRGWYTEKNSKGLKITSSVKATSNLTVYAAWEGIKYNVKFNSNSGTGTMENQEFTYGVSQPLVKNTFKKTGYLLKNWNTKADGTGKNYTNGQSINNLVTTNNGTITLYAIWEEKKLAVTFDCNGGAGGGVQNFTYGQKGQKFSKACSKDGYTLMGWKLDKNKETKDYNVNSGVSDKWVNTHSPKVTIYAHWEKNKYTVKYNSNSGTSTMNDQIFYYDTPANLTKNTFKKTGYTFKYWNTKPDGTGISYKEEQNVNNLVTTNNGSITLYAIWEPTTYTLTYNSNGGNACNPNSITRKHNNTWGELCTSSRSSYTFTGWNMKQDGSGTMITKESKATSNIVVYAQWKPIEYTVKFNSNGGEGTMKNQDFIYGTAQELRENTFKKENYTFIGWNTKSDGTGTQYTNKQKVSSLLDKKEILTLYAIWEPTTYTLTYNSNGGSICNKITIKRNYNSTWGSLCTPTREGYSFKKWNTKQDGSGDPITKDLKVTANLVVYAQWEGNQYTIKYNSNGGEGSMKEQTFTYGIADHLQANTFTRKDYRFIGWNTKQDGSGTSYSEEASVLNLLSTDKESMTLYAQWDKSSYEIEDYQVDYTRKYIDKVKLKTDLTNYKKKFRLPNEYTLFLDLGGKKNIYTGSITKIYYKNKEVISFVNIIRGDINGDGEINSGDLSEIKKHMLHKKNLAGVYHIAADVDDTTTIDSKDLLYIKQHIFGKRKIS